MTSLAREFRRQLDALGKERADRYFCSPRRCRWGACNPPGPTIPRAVSSSGELAETLDFINLMTYDMGTAFSAVSTFNAPLREDPADPLSPPLRRWNNVEGAIDYYQEHGVPAHKLVLGVPFYGRGFRVSSRCQPRPVPALQRAVRGRRLACHQEQAADRPALAAALASGRADAVAVPSRETASSSVTKIPGRSASAPNSPRTEACAASSCGNSPATTSSTACCRRWCGRSNDGSGEHHHHKYSCSVSSGSSAGMSCSSARWSG